MEPSNPTPESPITPPAAEQPSEPQTAREWLAGNVSTLLFVAVLIALMQQWLDWEGLANACLVAIGLGMVIFLHELGHFLVAKWCDVHVETFSIGFGPPLPGCKFQRGETTYMIALFPLGGYVKMVGEGAESEEEDNDPRSFKNKAVWQRMAIISAGVFMNLVLGIACFIFVYMARGVERRPAVIGAVDTGSPIYKIGAMSGDKIDRIGNATDPYFDQLMPQVALSSPGEQLAFIYGLPGKKQVTTTIVPRKNDEDEKPVIGMTPPDSLKLLPDKAKRVRKLPVLYTSAAAEAQPPFQWDDEIVASTDPTKNNEVTALKLDPRYKTDPPPDYFEFHRRAKDLAGQPMKVRVRRKPADPNASPEEVEIAVPPAYTYAFGLRMKMGQIMAIRENSPAAKGGVRPQEGKTEGDVIVGVVAVYPGGNRTVWGNPERMPKDAKPKDLDPMRLPWELTQGGSPKEVKLTVLRAEGHGSKNVMLTLAWDNSYRYDKEIPINSSSPWSVPELGLAYAVERTVVSVKPDSPADKARSEDGQEFKIEKDDEIVEYCSYLPGKEDMPAQPDTRKHYFFFTKENFKELSKTGWPNLFWGFQHHDIKELKLRVKRGDKTFFVVHVAAQPDTSWPADDRGFRFMEEIRLHKAQNMSEAIDIGFHRAFRFVGDIYRQLQALATGRLSFKLMSGPIGIAGAAYQAASMDIYMLILFLGIISVNLAVVNFLPIPLLDGGHMVFLIYEGLRGKPASETIRVGAMYVGLAVVGCLMLFVICLDLRRWW